MRQAVNQAHGKVLGLAHAVCNDTDCRAECAGIGIVVYRANLIVVGLKRGKRCSIGEGGSVHGGHELIAAALLCAAVDLVAGCTLCCGPGEVGLAIDDARGEVRRLAYYGDGLGSAASTFVSARINGANGVGVGLACGEACSVGIGGGGNGPDNAGSAVAKCALNLVLRSSAYFIPSDNRLSACDGNCYRRCRSRNGDGYGLGSAACALSAVKSHRAYHVGIGLTGDEGRVVGIVGAVNGSDNVLGAAAECTLHFVVHRAADVVPTDNGLIVAVDCNRYRRSCKRFGDGYGLGSTAYALHAADGGSAYHVGIGLTRGKSRSIGIRGIGSGSDNARSAVSNSTLNLVFGRTGNRIPGDNGLVIAVERNAYRRSFELSDYRNADGIAVSTGTAVRCNGADYVVVGLPGYRG